MPARMRIANAPVSFGVDEILVDDAWMAEPDATLDIMVELGFEGSELGPPGYLGTADEVRERLSSRGLQLVGSFLPQRFSRDDAAAEDRVWLKDSLRLVRDGSPEGSNPLAILSDGFDARDRMVRIPRVMLIGLSHQATRCGVGASLRPGFVNSVVEEGFDRPPGGVERWRLVDLDREAGAGQARGATANTGSGAGAERGKDHGGRCRRQRGTETEKGREAGHRVEAPVEAEDVLVEVVIEVIGTDPVVSPAQPGLEIRDHAMDAGHGIGLDAGPLHRRLGCRQVRVGRRQVPVA